MRIDIKQKITEDLRLRFEKSDALILTDYKGLDVESINLLRRRLKEVGAEFKVAKNSLLIRASKGNSVELIKDEFVGPSAIALCYGDPVAPAKVLTDFSSENPSFEIKTGVLGEKTVSAGDIKALALLPSREILLAQLLSSISAVPTSLVTLLSGVSRGFVNILQALKEKKEKQD